MYLELSEGNKPGYTWVPYSENPNEGGAYVRNDVLEKASKTLSEGELMLAASSDEQDLSGFFSSLWKGIKTVAGTAIKAATGVDLTGAQGGATAPAPTSTTVYVPTPAAPAPASDGKIFGMDKKTVMIAAGALVVLFVLMKKNK
jgi:hypothetical protein